MKAEERAFLADVINISKHKTLKNPYELKIERGEQRSWYSFNHASIALLQA